MYSADAHIRNVIQTDLFSAKFQIRKASVITSGRKLFSSIAVTHENYTIEMGHIWNKRTVMAYFHCRTRIRTQDRFLYYAGLSIPKMGTVAIWQRNLNPNLILSLCSGNMFCIILSNHRVWNPSPSLNLNPSPAVEISH